MTADPVQVFDPRTGTPVRPLRPVPAGELDALAVRLKQAQAAWLARGPESRSAVLLAFADALDAAAPELTAALVADTGRAVESAMEVQQVAGMCRRWAEQGPALLAPTSTPSAVLPDLELRGEARPYPLVGVISPWNFPLLLGLIDAIPALAAGCAVLVKPSEVTPRFIAPLNDAISTVSGLADVLAVVEGDGAVGARMVSLVDAVCFTGSVETGRRVGVAAAEAFIPAFLELGGKDPAVVLADADLDRAAAALLWGGTANAGQSCLSIERVYVARDVHDALVDLLVAKAERVGLAWPGPADGGIGPLIDPEQAAIIAGQLEDALAKGARIRTGGVVERHGGGHWVRPTVLTDVDHTMTVMTEETFGPVLPVMAFDTVAEAVALANDSRYGLSGAVFAADVETAADVARQLDVGAVSVNDAGLTAFVHEGEKNSFALSGLGGSRMGPSGLRRFLRRQALIVNHSTAPRPWWHQ